MCDAIRAYLRTASRPECEAYPRVYDLRVNPSHKLVDDNLGYYVSFNLQTSTVGTVGHCILGC